MFFPIFHADVRVCCCVQWVDSRWASVFINSVNQAKLYPRRYTQVSLKLTVIPWYTPEIYVSITSRSYSDLRNKWELNLVRSLFFILHWVHAVLRILNRNMGKEEELLKIVHNNDEKKLQVNTDPEVGDQITHCMYWVDFGVCYAMSFFQRFKCKS